MQVCHDDIRKEILSFLFFWSNYSLWFSGYIFIFRVSFADASPVDYVAVKIHICACLDIYVFQDVQVRFRTFLKDTCGSLSSNPRDFCSTSYNFRKNFPN